MLEKIKYPSLNRLVSQKLKLLKEEDVDYIKKVQIWKFNHQWEFAYNNFKIYNEIKIKHHLPNFISSLGEIKNFPRINKKFINDNFKIICSDLKTKRFTLSGGTSGEVTKFPTSYINEQQNYVNTVVCRKLHNAKNKDNTLYIWGHSHKLGKNIYSKFLKIFTNNLKDIYHKRKRVNAYDLSENNLKKIYYEIKKNKYQIIFSYASTFDILSNYLILKNFVYEDIIKIIFTSEHLNEETFIKLKKIFPRSQIIGEFGMAETGIIAYSFQDYKNYKLIWTDFIVQSHDKELSISEISNKTFPLINYFPDDYFRDNLDNETSILSLPEIIGKNRPNIKVIFENGKSEIYSTIYFDHILKNLNEIYSAQYFLKDETITIVYTGPVSEEIIRKSVINSFKQKVENVYIKKINKPIKTIGGKFKYLLNEKDISSL